MKTKRNWLASIILFVLLMSLASPLIALRTSASEDGENDDVRITPGTWYKLESNIITVIFPAGGKKPMFIWWYTKTPDQVYVVKYQGLIEYLAFDDPSLPAKPEYYNHLREAWQETWRQKFENIYFEPERTRMIGMNNMMKLYLLNQIMTQINQQMETTWHRAFLPFNAGRWTLSDIANITIGGKIIGISFAFRLVELPDWMPNLKFAENNIMIRVRFYNETVEETVPGTNSKYIVNKGEMKMDFVVNKWVWNIDTLKEFIQRLQNAGFDIKIPQTKAKLAIWVNLASINITKLTSAQEEPEAIEEHSTATHMEVEGTNANIQANETGETENPIEIQKPVIKVRFANETDKLGGFFRFVSSAKTTNYPNEGDVNMVPVKAAYISGGNHMRIFIGYPYFGNGTLEHDPSIGVDVTNIDNTPKYSVQTPSNRDVTPTVIGAYIPPLFSPSLMLALIVVISATAIILYAIKWKRKTPVNMVGVGTTG